MYEHQLRLYKDVIEKYNIDILNMGAKFRSQKKKERILPADKQCH